VALGRYPHQGGWGFETERDRLAVTRVLDTLSLGPLADRSITELSGGELHRVLIARALAQETDVLVLDEPNAHLDLRHQAQIFDLLHHLHTNGRTVVCVTHDLSLAATYARTAAVLSGGRIAAHGPAEEVIVPEVVSRYFDVRATVDRHGDAVSVGFIPDRTASDSTSKGV
jgi:iron complex transport system ATP-binding protein